MSTGTKVKVNRDHVIGIMEEAGWGQQGGPLSEKPKEWFEEKLPDIKDVVPEDFKPSNEEFAETWINICAAIEEGNEFEVEGDFPAESEPEKKGKGKRGKKKEDKPAAEDKEPKLPGVSEGRKTRTTVAAEVLADFGLDKGVTEEMVQEVNKRFGKNNDDTSKGALANAWAAITSYQKAKEAK